MIETPPWYPKPVDQVNSELFERAHPKQIVFEWDDLNDLPVMVVINKPK